MTGFLWAAICGGVLFVGGIVGHFWTTRLKIETTEQMVTRTYVTLEPGKNSAQTIEMSVPYSEFKTRWKIVPVSSLKKDEGRKE